jgi:hypothetical protein
MYNAFHLLLRDYCRDFLFASHGFSCSGCRRHLAIVSVALVQIKPENAAFPASMVAHRRCAPPVAHCAKIHGA